MSRMEAHRLKLLDSKVCILEAHKLSSQAMIPGNVCRHLKTPMHKTHLQHGEHHFHYWMVPMHQHLRHLQQLHLQISLCHLRSHYQPTPDSHHLQIQPQRLSAATELR